MQSLQEFIVNDHIKDLRREAESLRTEQRMRHRTRDADGGRDGPATSAGSRGARARVGHWVIGVGLAISGLPRDAHSGTAEHAA
jgi:hypothetical protein